MITIVRMLPATPMSPTTGAQIAATSVGISVLLPPLDEVPFVVDVLSVKVERTIDFSKSKTSKHTFNVA